MSVSHSPNLLLVAARAPEPGFTKTRLGKAIGFERAATLYRAFLSDVATTFAPRATESRAYVFGWAYTPAEAPFRDIIAAIAPDRTSDDVLLVPQQGDGWGERQANLLRWGHDHGYARTVLIASDSPHLARSTVEDAFVQLHTHDVALGRVHDGGYYLIGVRGFHDVLTGVPMSTASAADALVTRASQLGLRTAELPPTFDVDVEADLTLLIAHLASSNGSNAPTTWRTLAQLDLLPTDARIASDDVAHLPS